MTNAINAIQFAYTQYESEQIKKEDVKEKSPKKEVIYSQVKDFSSVEGNFSNQRIIQQGKSVFDMIRDSFFTQRGINVSYVSSVSGVSSTTEKIKSVASEMVSLQEELTNLVSTAGKLAGVDSSDKNLKEYQAKYVELYNKLADKKAEFDSYVNSSNLTDAKIRELCKDAYSKNENNNNNILNNITELTNKRQALATQTANELAEKDIESPDIQQLQAMDQVYMLEQEKLQQQHAISSLDLLSSNTKLEKFSTDTINLLIQFQNIGEERNIIAYQIAASAGSDTEEDNTKELEQKDIKLLNQQKQIINQLNIQNNNYDSFAYNLLFAPQNLSMSMQQSDLDYKLSIIAAKKDSIASQIIELSKTNPNSTEVTQLRAIYQVYELEQTSLKQQSESISNNSTIKKYMENVSKDSGNEYEFLRLSNQRQILAYQIASLEGTDSDDKLISDLKAKDAEIVKQLKQLKQKL